MLPAKIVGASVFRTVFCVLPYGRNDAPITGVSHRSFVGKRVMNRTTNAEFVAVPSGTDTKSVTDNPPCSSNCCANAAARGRDNHTTPAATAHDTRRHERGE